MENKVEEIVTNIEKLEHELESEFEKELATKRKQFHYSLKKGRAAFECAMCDLHAKLRKSWIKFLWEAPLLSLLVAPVIYSLSVPLVLLDAWLWLYQAVCFPAYGIEKVDRSRYIAFDRGKLEYLNWIEGINCDYCAYANGVVAYAREVASRTEQYFCPIKHSHGCAGEHNRYGHFLDFGDAEAYRKKLTDLREQLRPKA
jgi:hypothetical protein